MRTRVAAAAIALCAIVVTGVTASPTEARADEDAVKAAFLVNFAKFIQWPAPANGPLLVCLSAPPELVWQVSRLARTNTIDNRELGVRELRDGDDPADCEMLFVSSDRQKQSVELLQRARGPILTVGETVQFMREGGMVRFFVDDNRLRFSINQKAAEASGLKVSSKLLALSR
jgi:hypothetical protein